MTGDNMKIYTEEEMLIMLHTDVDKTIDIVSDAAEDMIEDLEKSVDDLMNLTPEEISMYVICKCYQHMYKNYYSDLSLVQMAKEVLEEMH